MFNYCESALLAEKTPSTFNDKIKIIKELSQDPITALLICFEYLIKSHNSQIIIHAECNKNFPFTDDLMEVLHSTLEQSRNLIVLIFKHDSYKKDYINYLKYKTMDPIFISYSHHAKGTNEYIKAISDGLENAEIKYSIDLKDLKYRQNIREYEELIGKSSRCIVIITPEYLESIHCMYELTQIFKHENARGRIFPLVDTGKYKINSTGLKMLRKYWEEQRMVTHDNASSPSPFTAEELKDIDTFIFQLDSLWDYVRNINTESIDLLIHNNAEKLIAAIREDIEHSKSETSKSGSLLSTVGLSNIDEDAPACSIVNQYGNHSIQIGTINGNININNSGK